jgi:hypothetical protein
MVSNSGFRYALANKRDLEAYGSLAFRKIGWL